ncbi:patatin-like phospholipase family protein [Granulosicoccaceae sp. 1_MG-2023]|nr:patatin-like phospholipase family protein [Granulosicoccaceae sp. 1_MG-2023]
MTKPERTRREQAVPTRVVLVFQGGGALGAYQAGVFEALQAQGIEPDWVIGTSIGAVNGALIAANPPALRVSRLREFWERVRSPRLLPPMLPMPAQTSELINNLSTLTRGLPGFFTPNPAAWFGGVHALLGLKQAAFYSTDDLRETLTELTDFSLLESADAMRLSLGAVNVRTAQMRYFDSRRDETPLGIDHVLASGALPPAFPAVMIEGDPWWDGGIVSNTPIEAIFDDSERGDALVFAVNLWQVDGQEPSSIWDTAGRMKDIQYASRADSHIADEKERQHLRRVIAELAQLLPDEAREQAREAGLLDEAQTGTLHIARLFAPALDGETHTKDIDFSEKGIRERWDAGFADASRMLEMAPWLTPCDRLDGIQVYTLEGLDEQIPEQAVRG